MVKASLNAVLYFVITIDCIKDGHNLSNVTCNTNEDLQFSRHYSQLPFCQKPQHCCDE